jgi:nitrite reductase (NADH) large subunit
MAGARLLEEVLARNAGGRFAITILGEEPHGGYNRALVSEVLSGARDAGTLLRRPREWYAERGVALRTGVRAEAIERDQRAVRFGDGEVVCYDRLILAAGSRPVVPPLEGLHAAGGVWKAGVFTLRTLEDGQRIAEQAALCRRACVLGGGLLGLEAAGALLQAGLEVHLVHAATHLMERQLDKASGALLKSGVESLGAHVHLNRRCQAVLGEGRVSGIALEDGGTLDCDLLLLACGTQPNTELAAGSGLAVGRGIQVDDQMRTLSDPSIYALGECAEHRGIVYGSVPPLWDQAQVLADHLTGSDPQAAYQGSRIALKLRLSGLSVTALGRSEVREHDELVQFSDPKRGIYKRLILHKGRLAGALLLGDPDGSPYLTQAFDRGTPLPTNRAALLFDLDRLGR